MSHNSQVFGCDVSLLANWYVQQHGSAAAHSCMVQHYQILLCEVSYCSLLQLKVDPFCDSRSVRIPA